MGGAKVILSTAPDAKAMSALPAALKPAGELLVIGAPSEPLSINVADILTGQKTIQGWPSGTAKDSEDTLRFSVQTGVRPDDREISAGENQRCLGADDEREGQIPRGVDYRFVTNLFARRYTRTAP